MKNRPFESLVSMGMELIAPDHSRTQVGGSAPVRVPRTALGGASVADTDMGDGLRGVHQEFSRSNVWSVLGPSYGCTSSGPAAA